MSPGKVKKSNGLNNALLMRLTASVRGQLFLCNLDAAIQATLIDPTDVSRAIATIKLRDIKFMHEQNLLGHLRARFQDASFGLILKHQRFAIFDDFLSGKPVVTVMRRVDFEGYYADPSDLITGHDFAKSVVGSSTNRFRPSATTNQVFWAAPSSAFSPSATLEKDAEHTRDALGLVHLGKRLPLVALHFVPPRDRCYRPTAIEAIPNARFRQIDPGIPGEDRWGITIDLALLDVADAAATISGKPELIFSRVRLADSVVHAFFHLGETISDRDTSTADDKFLAHLLGSAKIQETVSRLKGKLAP